MENSNQSIAEKISEANASMATGADNLTQLIVFKLGTEEYGLHIDQIKEVVLTPTVTEMPETEPYVKGVANIRGNIISIVDLASRFGINDSTTELGKYTLVVASDEFKIGILVKEVPNTLAINESGIEDVSGMFDKENMESGYIKGVVKIDERLIIMIDIYRVMSNAK